MENENRKKSKKLFSFRDLILALTVLAAAALLCEGNVIIDGAEAVAKSYPKFWEDWAKVTEGVCG